MSIDLEYALSKKNEPAVLCCRLEGGNELTHHNLEDPAIFPDLVDSGLLNLEGAVTIGQAMGATLKETKDSLTPLTPDLLDNIQEVADEAPAEKAEEGAEVAAVGTAPVGTPVSIAGGVCSLYIEEGKDIRIEFKI